MQWASTLISFATVMAFILYLSCHCQFFEWLDFQRLVLVSHSSVCICLRISVMFLTVVNFLDILCYAPDMKYTSRNLYQNLQLSEQFKWIIEFQAFIQLHMAVSIADVEILGVNVHQNGNQTTYTVLFAAVAGVQLCRVVIRTSTENMNRSIKYYETRLTFLNK